MGDPSYLGRGGGTPYHLLCSRPSSYSRGATLSQLRLQDSLLGWWEAAGSPGWISFSPRGCGRSVELFQLKASPQIFPASWGADPAPYGSFWLLPTLWGQEEGHCGKGHSGLGTPHVSALPTCPPLCTLHRSLQGLCTAPPPRWAELLPTPVGRPPPALARTLLFSSSLLSLGEPHPGRQPSWPSEVSSWPMSPTRPTPPLHALALVGSVASSSRSCRRAPRCPPHPPAQQALGCPLHPGRTPAQVLETSWRGEEGPLTPWPLGPSTPKGLHSCSCR